MRSHAKARKKKLTKAEARWLKVLKHVPRQHQERIQLEAILEGYIDNDWTLRPALRALESAIQDGRVAFRGEAQEDYREFRRLTRHLRPAVKWGVGSNARSTA